MAITAALVKELRDRTGLGMMDCKNALQESDGNVEQAIDELRKKSALKAAKKAGRTTAHGLLGVKISTDGKRAAMVEINCETDFAAKNDKFVSFVDTALNGVFDRGDDDLEKLLADGLNAEREALVQQIGENITVRRVTFFGTDDGFITGYLHGDKRKAALVELSGKNNELGRDLAMHITAIGPLVVASADVAQDLLAKEREIYLAQAQESGKPPEIIEKMVNGRVRKYLAEVSLLDQPFVKDGNVKVGALLASADVECRRFARFEVGEGIKVEKSDFAAEVAAQVKDSDLKDPD
ncbi:MAG: translation elongation factor Ts [Gammaproteobacteria bacterium]|nr:translation elongation factor Ts [Gammaproteobacteria bacterium]